MARRDPVPLTDRGTGVEGEVPVMIHDGQAWYPSGWIMEELLRQEERIGRTLDMARTALVLAAVSVVLSAVAVSAVILSVLR